MKVKKYKDFDDLYNSLIKEFLFSPNEIIDFVSIRRAIVKDIIISCSDYKCSIDLSKLGYSPEKKMKHLVKTYIDYDNLLSFCSKLKSSKSLTLTFYFNQKKINNGSCLIGLVFSREKSTSKWNKLNVLYRTSELETRMAADLVMLHLLIKEYFFDLCNLDEIVFFLPQLYCSNVYVYYALRYLEIKLKDLPKEHSWTKTLLRLKKQLFSKNSLSSKFASVAKIQKFYNGERKIKSEEISLRKIFENKIKIKKGE